MVPLERLLRYAVTSGASDIHMKPGAPPMLRVDGQLTAVPRAPKLGAPETERIASELLASHRDRQREFHERGEADLAHTVTGLGRFRVNVFRQRGSASIVMRLVPFDVPRLEELGLPPIVERLAAAERGIILVTGATGSGKSTTLAAMIDRINRSSRRHVVTIEDPIEFLHSDRMSIVNQREIGLDTPDFSSALRRVLRQDPDVIMIGEIRDMVTMETALSAAETGHLVLSTLHTLDTSEAVNRVIGLFPVHQEQQVRAMLAGTLRGVISQRLVKRADGSGRAAALEVLVSTGRVRDMIIDPAETGRIGDIVKEAEYDGMQTFDQALYDLVTSGAVRLEDALPATSNRHDFRLMLESGVVRRNAEQYQEQTPAAPVNGALSSAPPG